MKLFIVAAAWIAVASSAQAWDEDAKVVKPIDLAVQSHKYDGHLLQTTGNCFLADTKDIRCMIGNMDARLDLERVDGDGMSAYLFDKCSSLEDIVNKSCKFKIQFTYDGYDQMSTGSGTMNIVIAKDGIGELKRGK